MDPMDYVLHNQSRPAAHYDPVHAPSGPWMPYTQTSPAYPWQSHGQGLPQSYPHHHHHHHHPLHPAPGLGSDPFGLAPSSRGLPSPNPAFHAGPVPDSFAGAMPPRHFHHSHSPHRTSGSPPGPPGSATQLGPENLAANDGAFVNQIPGGRPLSFHSPVGLGTPAGNNLELNSLPRPPFPLSDLPTNNFGQHQHPLHFSVPPTPLSGPFNPTQPRRGHVSTSSASSRSFREVPSPTRPSQPSSTSRRSHPRSRRSMSSRFMASDTGREEDDDDELGRQLFLDRIIGGSRSESSDDAIVRQIQLLRGTVNNKMVASKMTLRSLQSVNIVDLPEAERTCVICYNDYGVETPEGINEAPLRLPKCQHIFGDHCIKKWFEDSDSCPYCRDKLHSEPKQHGTSARAFMNMMRMRGVAVPPGLSSSADEVFIRAMQMTTAEEVESARSASRQTSTGGRRSPPDDANEQQRRTRPRHSTIDRGTSSSVRPVTYGEGSSLSTPDGSTPGNAPGNVSTRALQQNYPPPMPQPRRAWQTVGTPVGESSETGRPGLAQPSNSMSPSAPSFYPRAIGNPAMTPDYLTLLGAQQSLSSSSSMPRLPNPLQSPGEVARGGGQQASVANMRGDTDETSQGSPDQNNRNRPW